MAETAGETTEEMVQILYEEKDQKKPVWVELESDKLAPFKTLSTSTFHKCQTHLDIMVQKMLRNSEIQ